MPAYRSVPPLPEIEWNLTVFHVLAEILAQDVEIAVLVDGQRIVEADAVVNQIAAPMHLAMYKSAVHVMIDVNMLF